MLRFFSRIKQDGMYHRLGLNQIIHLTNISTRVLKGQVNPHWSRYLTRYKPYDVLTDIDNIA
jgi:hypothetical protein